MFRLAAKFRDYVWRTLVYWLTYEKEDQQLPLSDFDRHRYALRPDGVLQVEGHTQISNIIKLNSLNTWAHSSVPAGRSLNSDDRLSIGRAEDADNNISMQLQRCMLWLPTHKVGET
jgi:hypothetical protein